MAKAAFWTKAQSLVLLKHMDMSDILQFHGSKTVKRYILTLLNIVSAIYGDPTLGADLKFVILRLIFFEGNSNHFNPIDESDSKQSLENVNRYTHSMLRLF